MKLPQPAKPEQQRIAEILDDLDRAIRASEQVITKLEMLKRGLLHDLLTRGVDENGAVRRQNHLTQFKPSEVGQIPAEWDCIPLARAMRSSPQNGLYKPASAYQDLGAPIVRIDGFYDGSLQPASTFKRVKVSTSELDTYRLHVGDVLVNRVNSLEYVGKTAYIPDLTEPTIFESNIMRLSLNQEILDSCFATLWMCSPMVRAHFHRRAKSAISQASINQTDVGSVPVALPRPHEQKEIVRQIHVLDVQIEASRSEVTKLTHLKHGLTDDLLTGRVRVLPHPR